MSWLISELFEVGYFMFFWHKFYFYSIKLFMWVQNSFIRIQTKLFDFVVICFPKSVPHASMSLKTLCYKHSHKLPRVSLDMWVPFVSLNSFSKYSNPSIQVFALYSYLLHDSLRTSTSFIQTYVMNDTTCFKGEQSGDHRFTFVT